MFTYDWFHRGGLQRQVEEAKRRCAAKRYPDGGKGREADSYQAYFKALTTRTILYLKDGLSYEMKEICDLAMTEALAIECVPVDENYQVGAYVIIIPFEDIARVEVFAVHPDEKPSDTLRIPGFRPGSSERD
ncbi:MAG: hypothetical protein SF069_10905 [Phycisphaerae bacterium]|nr:hypothetical protein [Phycisphaerae bacterium]